MIMVLTVISHGFAMILHIAIFRCFINLPQQWMLLISANICFMALSEDTVPNKNPKKNMKNTQPMAVYRLNHRFPYQIAIGDITHFQIPNSSLNLWNPRFSLVKSSFLVCEPLEIPSRSTFAPTCCWTLPPGEVEKTGRSFQYQNNYIATSKMEKVNYAYFNISTKWGPLDS